MILLEDNFFIMIFYGVSFLFWGFEFVVVIVILWDIGWSDSLILVE